MDSNEDDGKLPLELNVSETQSLLQGGDQPILLDVREPIEVMTCQIANSIHMPMGEIPLQWQSLPRDKRIIVYCHHGRRSLMVAHFLRQHGLKLAQSMFGGIEAWSLEIDPGVPRY